MLNDMVFLTLCHSACCYMKPLLLGKTGLTDSPDGSVPLTDTFGKRLEVCSVITVIVLLAKLLKPTAEN